MAEPRIRNHKERKEAAECFLRNNRITYYQREAYIEFFLIEDIYNLYTYRLKISHLRYQKEKDAYNRHIYSLSLQQFCALLDILKKNMILLEAMIQRGEYKVVEKSIPEHKLMRMAANVKNLHKLAELASKLHKRMSEETLKYIVVDDDLRKVLADEKSHFENSKIVKGLMSDEETLNMVDDLLKQEAGFQQKFEEVDDAIDKLVKDHLNIL
ncbi:MAG: hypothetical protein ACI4M5_01450 [Christensenellales bacterium]